MGWIERGEDGVDGEREARLQILERVAVGALYLQGQRCEG